ncbi:FAD-dependent monooxygenase [Paenibacillus humicola]|uniref:FAD-dependent monooxygenase n=1 Tax=Paenibacillus humicola TaxID=3110540 RepID=UPI00237B6A78|nr:FAD-dependent monooxygenase [Paenibacillus humicola]
MEVLIVGAGPVGLTAACELARHGIRPRIIDKAPLPSPFSKALGIHARTMEVFERMGVDGAFLEQGMKVHGINIWLGSDKRTIKVRFDGLDSPYPFILDLPQSQTERILSQCLTERYGVRIERGVELLELEQRDGFVEVKLLHPDGTEETAQTAWLLGMDGAHSTVRHRLGVPFEGSAYPESFVLADVRIEWDLEEDLFQFFSHDQGILAAFSYGNQRYRLMADAEGGADPDGKVQEPTLEQFQRIVDERCPVPAKLSEPVWLAGFRTHLRHVKQTRHGRVFLAGDASHIHSPAGGQGMNTGIQDAFNLAWKLALVVKGHAEPSLLETYPVERIPVAESVLKMTDTMMKIVTEHHAVVQKLRNHIAPFIVNSEIVQHRMREQLSEIAVHYRHSPIVREHHASLLHRLIHSKVRAGDRAPDVPDVIGPDSEAKRLYEILRGTNHALLLVVKDWLPVGGELDRLSRWSRLLDVYVVAENTPVQPNEHYSLIQDPEQRIAQRYGLNHNTMILLRPDGYIGYLGDSFDFGSLQSYLDSFLIP